MSKVSRFVLATALALAAGGCSTAVQGTPTTAPSAPQSGTPDPENLFAALPPCKVLDQLLQGRGYNPSQPSAADKKHSCNATKSGSNNVAILLKPGIPFDKNVADPSKTKNAHVNTRRAIEQREGLGVKGDCDVSMEVVPNSTASILVSAESTELACTTAEDLSTKLEPLLPK